MNRLLILFAFSALMVFSNCKPDKEPTPVTPETQENSIKKLLLGKWRMTFSALDENMNGVPDESEKEFSDEPSFVTFNIDGTLTVTDAQGIPDEQEGVQWSIKDKEITLTVPPDSLNPEQIDRYTIVSLNTIDMLWKFQEDSLVIFLGFVKE